MKISFKEFLLENGVSIEYYLLLIQPENQGWEQREPKTLSEIKKDPDSWINSFLWRGLKEGISFWLWLDSKWKKLIKDNEPIWDLDK